MSKRIVEKHVTIDEETYNKLRLICKKEDRTLRAVLTRLINKEFENGKNISGS